MRIIGGLFRNRSISAPKGSATRPTSSRLRETVFNICQGVVEGSNFLDLFSGSGAMGFEALSRGAHSATFVDASRQAMHALRENIDEFKVKDQVHAICGDVFSVISKLARQGQKYEIIYADPPYETKVKGKDGEECYGIRIVKLLDDMDILSADGRLFVEEGVDFSEEIGGLATLQLCDVRRNGRAYLFQFRRKEGIT